MVYPYINGFFTGCCLIIAIGAQNAFVLSQGIKKDHNFVIPLICSICDAVLIFSGIAGVGRMTESNTSLISFAITGGAVFLFIYGFNSLRLAFKGDSQHVSEHKGYTLKAVIFITLGITLLNPQVYIETVLLMGSLSLKFSSAGKLLFGAGAVSASVLWFFSLSYGSAFLAPLFKNKKSWRILDSITGITMWIIAVTLVV